MILARLAAVIAGLILVAAAAHGTVTATGGYGTSQSYATIAVAIGVVVGSGVFGFVRSAYLAFFLFVVLLAGEGYALINTANRVVAASDAAQAPLIDARQRHNAAVQALADARAMKPTPASRDRLDAAERAKGEAEKAAREQAALPGCRVNCAKLLTDAVNNTSKEVDAARAELRDHDQLEAQRIANIVTKAEADVKANPLPPSATPFADRIGVAPWIIDLVSAALLSLGLNGLAAALIAFATHDARPTKTEPTGEAQQPSVKVIRPPADAGTAVIKFMSEKMPKAKGAEAEWLDVHAAFERWWERQGIEGEAPTPEHLARILQRIAEKHSIPTLKRDGRNYFIGRKLAS